MPDEAFPRLASRSTRCGLFSVDVKRVPVFLPSPFVFHVVLSSGFNGSGGLVDFASLVQAIGCLCCPLKVIDVTSCRGPFQSVFVYFPSSRFVTNDSEQYFI